MPKKAKAKGGDDAAGGSGASTAAAPAEPEGATGDEEAEEAEEAEQSGRAKREGADVSRVTDFVEQKERGSSWDKEGLKLKKEREKHFDKTSKALTLEIVFLPLGDEFGNIRHFRTPHGRLQFLVLLCNSTPQLHHLLFEVPY